MLKIEGYNFTQKIYENKNTLIYRGIRKQDNLPIIAKLPNTNLPAPWILERYAYEYTITKTLDLPQIVSVYALLNIGHSRAIIKEDFGAISLSKYMLSYTIDLKMFLEFALALIKALESVHQKNIIHKDIKSRNILINPTNNTVKLNDFCIAIQLNKETQAAIQLSPEKIEGTLAYMSPEQTGRMNRALDYRTDFYSLGVTFYEMLTGKLPFQTTEPLELVHSHIAKQPVPLYEIKPTIPPVVSDIVLKLLAKNAEDRYQTAYSLKADLSECLARCLAKSTFEKFIIGQADISGKFLIPQKLYGRINEVAALMAAFERVNLPTARGRGRGRGNEMLLVSGYAGVGKTALINEIQKPITQQRGYFICGKFDQLNQNIAYSAITQAFQGLIKHILGESQQKILSWKDKLSTALVPNGQIIIDVIPEIELIIGKMPPVQTLGATETQNRFNLVFQNFVSVFVQKEHPLVLFLDDLQWADTASLYLIDLLLSSKDIVHLLIIGAYRDNEVCAAHPLISALETLGKKDINITEIKLQPLKPAHLSKLVADTLHCALEPVQALADLLYQKTEGNPFFFKELFNHLYQENYLRFLQDERRWDWALEKIRAVEISDNVVNLMIARLKKQAAKTQKTLQLATCIGNCFDLNTLSVIEGQSPAMTANNLWDAIQMGIIVPLSDNYRFVHVHSPDSDGKVLNIHYKFQHDRVQQAAYALIQENQKKAVHLQIGRLMLHHATVEELEEKVIEIVSQLNEGINLIKESQEREKLARLNLAAGKKTKSSIAYRRALEYFAIGKKLLPIPNTSTSWKKHYELTFELYRQYSECAYLCGEFEQAQIHSKILLEHAKTKLEKAEIYKMQLVQYTIIGKLEEAIQAGIQGLSLLGINLSAKPNRISILMELFLVKWQLGKRKIADLVDQPTVVEQAKKISMKILMDISTAAYLMGNEHLYLLAVLKGVNISLHDGNCPESAHAYVIYGLLLKAVLGDLKRGYEFGELARKLNDRFSDLETRCRVFLIYAITIHCWNQHWKTLIPYLKIALEAGYQSGDLRYMAYTCMHITQWNPELDLEAAIMDGKKYLNLIDGTQYQEPGDVCKIHQQYRLNLRGCTKARFSLSDSSFDEFKCLERMKQAQFVMGVAVYHLYKLQIYFFYEDYSTALSHVKEMDKVGNVLMGTLWTMEFCLYAFLNYSSLYPEMNPKEKRLAWKRLKKEHRQMKKWADHCPVNFLHHRLIMEAEMARLSDQAQKAASLYNEAIEAATKNEYLRYEALAYELAAKFYLTQNQEQIAGVYMNAAYYHYNRWGATAKLQHLAETYPLLIPVHEYDKATEKTSVAKLTTSSETVAHKAVLDLATVTKASQALSSEFNLDKLLEKMMRIVIENVGAQSGMLILNKDSQLFIEVAGEHNKIKIERHSIKVENPRLEICHSIINYVARTQQSVVLHNATQEGTFTDDPYIVKTQPKSILCFPIIYQGDLFGLLYLENNLSGCMFTEDRLELLDLLSTQIAISIENATYYTRLEKTVAERTEELSIAKARAEATSLAKSQFLVNMSHEIRTQLNAIVGFTQLLLHQGKELSLPSEFQQFLDNVKFSGQNLSELISNILDLSKFEADKMSLSEDEINLKLLVQGVFHINKTLAQKKGIIFSYHLAPQLPPVICSDRAKLNQILMNLVGNAIKFTSQGKAIQIKAAKNSDNDFIIFQVIDEGVGIPPEYQPFLLSAFEQVDVSTTQYFEGTGLGLAIVKKMVDLLAGEFIIESAPGKGSVFSVKIPLIEATTPSTESPEIDFCHFNFSKENVILLVEDNRMNQDVLMALFHRLDLELMVADNGKIGVEKALALKPDLILMDMHMPEMDGFTAAKTIRENPTSAEIPIVMVSTDALVEQKPAFEALGIHEFVTKPIDFSKLFPVLVKYLRQDRVKVSDVCSVSLPKLLEKQLLEEFTQISHLSILDCGQLMEKIGQIQALCQGFDCHYPDILSKIEDAVFNGDEEQLEILVRGAIETLTNNYNV